jgi:polyprenyl-phospho-N-acetylgalactosaminyl synthase
MPESQVNGAAANLRVCFLIPTYNNPITVKQVSLEARKYLLDVLVIDDGSSPPGRAACEELQSSGLATVHHRPANGGKGAAVKSGFEVARSLGYTHVLQVDADGQHDLAAVPAFLSAMRSNPSALIMGYPVYDASAPLVRRIARKFTDFWVAVEAGRGVIRDAMVGFRVYPLAPLKALKVAGNRMDFDIEVAIRLVWEGVPVINLPVSVRYLAAAEGGVSHFRPLGDNLRFSWLHSRLCTVKCMRWVLGFFAKKSVL